MAARVICVWTTPTRKRKARNMWLQSSMRCAGWGFSWHQAGIEHLYYASDYYETLYRCAEILVERGHAYVDSQSPEAIRANRGTLTEPGIASPYRTRAPE